MTLAIAVWPNARGNEGMGALFKETGTRHVMAGWLLGTGWTGGLLALCPWLAQSGTALWLVRQGPLPAAAAASSLPADNPLPVMLVLALPLLITVLTLAVGWPLAERMSRKLGGLTGDTYGDLNELLELVLLAAAVIVLRFI